MILIGLPESSLLEAKTAIDNMFIYLIGKNVKIVDDFRLGHRSESSAWPRPLLIKLDNHWDRILTPCRELKDYTVSKLFLREDLPPEARTTKSQTEKALVVHVPANADTAPSKQPPSVTAVATQPSVAQDATDKSVLTSYNMICSTSRIRFCTYNCQGWRSAWV